MAVTFVRSFFRKKLPVRKAFFFPSILLFSPGVAHRFLNIPRKCSSTLRLLAWVLLLLLFSGNPTFAQADSLYGVALPSKEVRLAEGRKAFLQKLAAHPQLSPAHTTIRMQPKHAFEDRTTDFFFLLVIVLLLGMIRFANPRYFGLLWRAFYHPTHTSQALRDQLDADPLPNAGMNVLFACTTGAYLYGLLRLYSPAGSYAQYPSALVLVSLILGVGAIYAFKALAIRFSGWAFGVSAVTDQYLFNVFLINKILAVLLLPAVFILSFAGPQGADIVVIISLLVVGVLVAMRYARSWLALRNFFANSRFHFLTYFCASEILPLAVLTKFVARALTL